MAESTTIPSPKSLFKGIAQGTGLYSIANLIPQIASVFLLPISTRFLTRTDYGIADLLQQTSSVLSVLLGVNFTYAVGYFYFKSKDEEGRARVTSTSVLGAALLGTIGAIVCWPLSGYLAGLIFPHVAAAGYLRLSFVVMPAAFALEALMSWLRVAGRPATFTLFTAVRTVCTILATILFLAVLKAHVWGILWSTVCAAGITTVFLAAYCFRTVKLAFARPLFWQMVKYSAPIGVGGLAVFVIHFGDRFILPHYRSFAEIGIYSLAYKIAMLLSVVSNSFVTYWGAQAFDIMQRPDANSVFTRLLTYVTLVLTFSAVVLICFSKPVLAILAGPGFQGAAPLVPLLVLAYYLRGLNDFFRCLFLVEGRTGYDAICNWLGAAVCIVAYFALIPHFGVWGAAWATVIAFGAMVLLAIGWTYRIRPYKVEGRRLLKMLAASAGALAFRLLIPGSGVPSMIASAVASVSVFAALLVIFRFPTKEERRVALHTVRSASERLAIVARL